MWNAPSPDVRPSPRRRWVGGGRLGGLAEACHPQKVGWLMLIHHPPPQIRLQSIEKRTFRSMPYRGRRFMTFMTVPWQSLSSHRRCAGFESSGSDPVPLGTPAVQQHQGAAARQSLGRHVHTGGHRVKGAAGHKAPGVSPEESARH